MFPRGAAKMHKDPLVLDASFSTHPLTNQKRQQRSRSALLRVLVPILLCHNNSKGVRNMITKTTKLGRLSCLYVVASVLLILSVMANATSSSTSSKSKSLKDLDYRVFPRRKSEEAAVLEWGHSAIIHALEAAVAGFGPQPNRGAFFEVETSPVLARPIDGNTKFDKFDNSDEIHGNLVVMTNAANLSGVRMAQLAQNSGAAALLVINIQDSENPDYIYSLQPENEEEKEYAENEIDIPVIMASLAGGNLLTSANEDHTINNGMPDRVRLYGGGDRPFFEDVSSEEPMLYLIHNLLTEEECDDLINSAEGKFEAVDDSKPNLLEGTPAAINNKMGRVLDVERAFLWKGMTRGPSGKAIDERIEQVTGFPEKHLSDFQVNKYNGRDPNIPSSHSPHYDELPGSALTQMATITIFLTDSVEEEGGEMVFPSTKPAIKIRPKKGMAVVHHNIREDGHTDISSIHGELGFQSSVKNGHQPKYTAKRYVYVNEIHNARKVVLPLLALPFGGKLPNFVFSLHDYFVDKFGEDVGGENFNKFIIYFPIALIFGVAALIGNILVPSEDTKKKTVDKTKKNK